jgi:mannose-1-phosphate guanylyltransferase
MNIIYSIAKDMRMQHDLPIVPVILAGGRGLRLRPLTSRTRPKPFVKLPGIPSMFQNTLRRVSGYAAPLIVTHRDYEDMAKADLRQIGIAARDILCEPDHRGTAAALAMAALALRHDDVLMLVCPVDHDIQDEALFHQTIEMAALQAQQSMCLIGARPSGAYTRYGYIRARQGRLLSFHEKPDRETASAYCLSREYLWNTGIFVCRPQDLINLLRRYAPNILAAVDAGKYDQAPSLTIDYAVMDHLQEAAVCSLSLAAGAILAAGLRFWLVSSLHCCGAIANRSKICCARKIHMQERRFRKKDS